METMKKIIALLACCLAAATVAAQEKKAYAVFDANGRETDYGQMMKSLGEQDVVFIGEVHNCAIAHWMEYEIVRDLYALHKDRLTIGAEMFERDGQLVLDEYLGGIISAERFEKESKLWPNYKTDYAAIVEFAKANGIPFVATNVPRRYANIVSRGGFEALDRLTDEAKRYIAPLPLDYVPNRFVDAYFAAMSMPGMKSGSTENLSKAQAIKDATMAWSIGPESRIQIRTSERQFPFDGPRRHHYLSRSLPPGLKIGTVEVVRQENIGKLDEKALGHADFYICVPKSMTSTY